MTARRRARQRAMRRRRAAVLALLTVTVALVGVDFLRGGTSADQGTEVTPVHSIITADGAELAPPQAALPTNQPGSGGAKTPVKNVVKHGSGSFTIAPGRTPVVGTGQLMTYRVEVENGSGEDPAGFAAQVDGTLGDPRSWTAKGQWAFRRVSSGSVNFVVRLASPDTVDRICGAAGLDTGGFTSCRTGQYVVLNVARWELAVPDFAGDLDTYRHYVVNHEVGHRLKHGHEACPGAGQLAPVMMQQTYGLKGCVANGWPFVDGKYISGPPTVGQ
ncbi:MAG: hypothetical protein QOJ50_499 [Cryptosporangiaceae bacterium]|nr:hypothetical protein [Cryptosporangiaceae bacterium]